MSCRGSRRWELSYLFGQKNFSGGKQKVPLLASTTAKYCTHPVSEILQSFGPNIEQCNINHSILLCNHSSLIETLS